MEPKSEKRENEKDVCLVFQIERQESEEKEKGRKTNKFSKIQG